MLLGHSSRLRNKLMLDSLNAYKRGAAEVGSVMKRMGLHLAKRGSEGITSSFVAIRTNLFPSQSLTHALNPQAAGVYFTHLPVGQGFSTMP